MEFHKRRLRLPLPRELCGILHISLLEPQQPGIADLQALCDLSERQIALLLEVLELLEEQLFRLRLPLLPVACLLWLG